MEAPGKQIGLFLAVCIVAGSMIGSGVFLLPAVLASVGSGSLLAWAGGAVGAIVLSTVFARLAIVRPDTEGLIDYPRAAFYPVFGFFNWAAYWIACWIGNVAVLLAAVGYFKATFGLELSRAGDMSVLIAGIWLATGAAMIGPRFVGRISAATLILGLAPLVVAIFIGFLRFDPALFVASWNISGEPLLTAASPLVLTVFWAFLGLESANAVSKTVRDPHRNVPRAAIIGTAIAALIYALATAALFGLLPASVLQASSAPFADAIGAAFGAAAGVVIAGAAFARTFGCAAGWQLVTSEANRSGVAHGYLPKFVASHLGGRRDVAFIGILMTAAALMTASPTLNEQFSLLVDFSVLMFMYVYGLSSLALIRYATRSGDRVLGLSGTMTAVLITAGYFALS